jgi:hypothetical protein
LADRQRHSFFICKINVAEESQKNISSFFSFSSS